MIIQKRVGPLVLAAVVIAGVCGLGAFVYSKFAMPPKQSATQLIAVQKDNSQKNSQKTGDWTKLEKAFTKLEEKGIVVARELSVCPECTAGDLQTLTQSAAKTHPVKGYAFYVQFPTDDISAMQLTCGSTTPDGSLTEQSIYAGGVGTDEDKAHVLTSIKESLASAGLSAGVQEQGSTINIPGSWSSK